MTEGAFTRQQQMEAMLAAREKRVNETFPVLLPNFSKDLGMDITIQVRKFEVGEDAIYYGASESLSQRISERTADYAKLMADNNIELNDDGTVSEVNAGIFALELSTKADFRAFVDTVCLAVAVDPPLVETEAEAAANPNAWLLKNLAYGDRLQIFYRSQAGGDVDGGEGKAMEQFRQEAPADVEGVEVKPAAKTSKRGARTKRSGVDGESAA